MLKGIAILTLLILPGSFIVLSLACLHPAVREKAMTLLGVRLTQGRRMQTAVGLDKDGKITGRVVPTFD